MSFNTVITGQMLQQDCTAFHYFNEMPIGYNKKIITIEKKIPDETIIPDDYENISITIDLSDIDEKYSKCHSDHERKHIHKLFINKFLPDETIYVSDKLIYMQLIACNKKNKYIEEWNLALMLCKRLIKKYISLFVLNNSIYDDYLCALDYFWSTLLVNVDHPYHEIIIKIKYIVNRLVNKQPTIGIFEENLFKPMNQPLLCENFLVEYINKIMLDSQLYYLDKSNNKYHISVPLLTTYYNQIGNKNILKLKKLDDELLDLHKKLDNHEKKINEEIDNESEYDIRNIHILVKQHAINIYKEEIQIF